MILKVKDVLINYKNHEDVISSYEDRLEEEIVVPSNKKLEKAALLMKCLSNPLRLKMLAVMRRPHCVCVIAGILNKDCTLISHHLALMRSLGIVKCRSYKKIRMYEINKDAIRELIDYLTEIILSE